MRQYTWLIKQPVVFVFGFWFLFFVFFFLTVTGGFLTLQYLRAEWCMFKWFHKSHLHTNFKYKYNLESVKLQLCLKLSLLDWNYKLRFWLSFWCFKVVLNPKQTYQFLDVMDPLVFFFRLYFLLFSSGGPASKSVFLTVAFRGLR